MECSELLYGKLFPPKMKGAVRISYVSPTYTGVKCGAL